ncbi:MAG: ribosomal RNA small subunit methyltransferase A [Candidatus Coatesbacteria bacterium]|nr:ribosomal RNA small subunit methyltransferase A [Candidatus Coatesbacteria bacterium]
MTQNIAPKRSLGQVFLKDQNILEKIAALVEPNGKVIIEIGAGDGRLTNCLAKSAETVYAVELDRGLFERLKSRFEGAGNVHLFCLDARKLDLRDPAFAPHAHRRFTVVGNLPYCSFVHILLGLMRQLDRIDEIQVMGQKEVADRLMAQPNASDYGRLSVIVQAMAEVKRILPVPPTAFWPRPKVDSLVVGIIPKEPPFNSAEELAGFDKFVSAAFSHRRKIMLNSLSQSALRDKLPHVEAFLEEMGIPKSCRAQEIDVTGYISLFARLACIEKNDAK